MEVLAAVGIGIAIEDLGEIVGIVLEFQSKVALGEHMKAVLEVECELSSLVGADVRYSESAEVAGMIESTGHAVEELPAA